MKQLSVGAAVLVLLGIIAGCNTLGRQPQLKDATIAPAELKPGDSAVITVVVRDRHKIVNRVEGVVLEDPSIKLKLHDDGVAPDKKAGDDEWSLQVDVPFQAPPGQFMLQLTAYRSDGTPVPVRDTEGNTVPLAVTIPVVIGNP